MDLEDLVYSYPSLDEPNFQTLISSKFEFRQLATSRYESIPARGQPFRHQELILRYMLQYDRLLLIHDAGTGKTCSSAFPAENLLRRNLTSATVDFVANYVIPRKTSIRKVYVLTRGPALISEFRFQLVCKCTGGIYESESLARATTGASRESRITAEIGKYYSIGTYGRLAKRIVRKGYTDEQLAERYADCFFIVDEPQYLKDPSLGEERGSYEQLHRLFHLAKRSKVMATTATPMVNSVNEFPYLANLILPLDKQLSVTADYGNATLEELGPQLQGYVSYVRALDTGLNVVFEGQPITGEESQSQMVVEPSQMSEFQTEGYVRGLKEANGFHNAERQASNFVFPDLSFGTEGFERFTIKRPGEAGVPDVYLPNEQLAQALADPSTLYSMSCKFYKILQLIGQSRGNNFCYSNSLVGSGSALFAMTLVANGYEQFLESVSAFASAPGQEAISQSYCLSVQPGGGPRQIRIAPNSKRFALITSRTPDARRRNILELFNSYENRHGEYLKVIIASPVAKAGINLANVIAIHLIDSDWNEAGNYQALSRGIRATSHTALLEEARELAVAENRDPTQARVTVNVYRHVAIPIPELVPGDESPIDLTIYLAAEQKDILIHRMLRILKQVAVDCQIHRERNIRPEDVDYSPTCDYLPCNYVCASPEPDSIDTSSFDVLYSSSIVEEITREIFNIFTTRFSLSFTELSSILSIYAEKYLIFALSRIFSSKQTFIDRFGRKAYLREDAGFLYLQNDFPLRTSSYPLSFYTENLISVSSQPLISISNEINAVKNGSKIEELLSIDPSTPRWSEVLGSLSSEGRAILLETAISSGLGLITLPSGPISEATSDAINAQFAGLWFSFHEPVPQLNRRLQTTSSGPKRRGRPPKPENVNKVRKVTSSELAGALELPTDTETVFIHIIYNTAQAATSHAVTTRASRVEGRIRLLKPSEGVWRDTNDYETPVYNEIVQRFLADLRSRYEVYDIYGTIYKIDNNFRIRDKTSENQEASSRDSRNINSGRICTSWNKPALVQLMWQINVQPSPFALVESREEMITCLERRSAFSARNPKSGFSDEKIVFFYRWLCKTRANRRQLCQIIQNELEKQGRLFVI